VKAVLSDCGTYRYALWRDIPQQLLSEEEIPDGPWYQADDTVLFVMLNPSTADASQDDPTIRKCIGFAKGWGFGSLAVANLYAYRATQPHELGRADDPIGPENDDWIVTLANEADCIIAAWGASPYAAPERAREVVEILDHDTGVHCLGLTKDGHPCHPLMLPYTTEAAEYGVDVFDRPTGTKEDSPTC
jgi:hypothetical protein